MKRWKLVLLASVFVTGASITAGAVMAGGGFSDPGFPVSAGTVISRDSLSLQDRALLDYLAATGTITRVGSSGDVTFYTVDTADGGRCYGFMTAGEGLDLGCSHGSSKLEQPLVDMSTVEMNPSSGSFRLRALQGIAADGVAAVGIVDENGDVHTTPVSENVYRWAGRDLPAGRPRALLALDTSGHALFTVSLNPG